MLSILVLVPTVPLFSAQPAKATHRHLQPKVQALIDRLDANTNKERVQAATELLRFGPQILPLLQQLCRSSNASHFRPPPPFDDPR